MSELGVLYCEMTQITKIFAFDVTRITSDEVGILRQFILYSA